MRQMNQFLRFALSAARRTSRIPLVRPAFAIAIVALLWPPLAGSLLAYTSVRVALHSNILVDGKRVIFAQGTGSLTVLNLETGAVLLRKAPKGAFEYSGTLQSSVHGVLMMSYETIALLDRNSFEPIWRADRCHDAVSDGEHVVSHDGYHTVTCRQVQTGRVSWKIDMEGGWHLLAARGKVLVATTEHWNSRHALQVLDLKSGGQLLQHEGASGVHWHQVFFDGQLIYLVEGNAADRYESPRKSLRLKALDLEGKVAAEADYKSTEVVSRTGQWNITFIWGNKYFDDRRVQTANAHERQVLATLWKTADECRNMLENETGFPDRRDTHPWLLPSGVFANLPRKDSDNEIGQVLVMNKPKGSWTAYAPYLGKVGSITHVAEVDGNLLLGSSEGHLECLDAATGRPRWLYAFPVIRQTVTYSAPHGMPPYLTRQAAEYRKGIERISVTCGSILLPADSQPSTKWATLRAETEYPGQIFLDPSPDDPFAELPGYIIWLAVCASIPIVAGVVLLLVWLAGRRNSGQALIEASPDRMSASTGPVACFLAVSLAPAYGLLAYGRVSYSWTIALKVIFVMTLVVALFGTCRLVYVGRWVAALVLFVILLAWLYLMFNPLRFA
jgi:outer membrane protein assembly factor BamB